MIDSTVIGPDDEFMPIEYYILNKIDKLLMLNKDTVKKLHLVLVFKDVSIDDIEATSSYFNDSNFRSRIDKFSVYNFTVLLTFSFFNANYKELRVFNEYNL